MSKKSHFVIVDTENGEPKQIALKTWIRDNRNILPEGFYITEDTSHMLRRKLVKQLGWKMNETDTSVFVVKPDKLSKFEYAEKYLAQTIEEDKPLEQKSFYDTLNTFLAQAKTTSLKNKDYSIRYLGTKVKASFGQGAPAKIPWISFTIDPNTTSQGIYPVYLYYKNENALILAYGVSETAPSKINWINKNPATNIATYFKENFQTSPDRYGDSYVFKVYEADNLPSKEIIDADLYNLIEEYKSTALFNQNKVNSNDPENGRDVFSFQSYANALNNAHLKFSEPIVKRFIASILTKPFVILTGLAGSGKTKMAQSFIQWICENDKQYKIVAVGADWINREPLLGYPNGLKSEEYVTPDNGVLELMIEASQYENQDKPYFILLDEMNLSHVERYFADFLSVMESNDSIKLYTGNPRQSIPKTISWPENLFIIGTVNIDETTYMFSPKVLDRANVIEFRLDDTDLSSFLKNPQKVDLRQLVSKGASMGSDFVNLAKTTNTQPDTNLNDALLAFFKALKPIGAEFGYRSAFEIHLLYTQLGVIDGTLTTEEKTDFAIMQKLLPKLHGSRSKIVKPLETLMKLCLKNTKDFSIDKLKDVEEANIKYKVSFEKLKRMYENALSNGFTSYAEA